MITMSDLAAEKIREILKVEGLPNHGLRIVVSGGGCCGGSQYEITIDDKAGEGDTVVEKNGSRLFLDAATARALEGAELGYAEEGGAEGFVLSFPYGSPMAGGGGCGTADTSSGCGCS